MTPALGGSNPPCPAQSHCGNFKRKVVFIIIPITETEYKALRKILSVDEFAGMHCHYNKHYMVSSKENLNALKQYRENLVTERHFGNARKKKK